MRVFVTGATGFVGFAIVKELLAAGHHVTGLARSDASEQKLISAGAQALRGDIQQLDVLRKGASAAEGVIHTAFFHEIAHLPFSTRMRVFLGGLPTGIVSRFLQASLAADRHALEVMGNALRPGSPLIGTFGTLAMTPGLLATEEDAVDPNSPGGARGATEQVIQQLAAKGVRACVLRLPPVVHGPGDRNGFMPTLIKSARKNKASVYLGNGANRWPAVHQLDAARLFRLVLEQGVAGAAYHGVAEEGIPFGEIAGKLGAGLGLPVVSKPEKTAAKQFSFLAPFVAADNPTSSALTRQHMGWIPTQAGLLSDLAESGYLPG